MKQVQIRFAGDNKYITKRRGILPVFGYQGQFFIADVTGAEGEGEGRPRVYGTTCRLTRLARAAS